MGKGISILLWDGWGAGCVRLNPRLAEKGLDIYGNPNNWFSYTTEQEKQDIISKLTTGVKHYHIIH